LTINQTSSQKYKPDVLIAFSSYCKALAEHCENTGKELSFRVVVTAGDLLDEKTRNQIENSFNAEVFDNYGIEEAGGLIAWECPTHSGYHVDAESLAVELLRNGEPAAEGQTGDLYVTCFHRKATPIIRYFTGDGAQGMNDYCTCGRNLPLLRNIQGRVLDYISTSNGNYVSPHEVLNMLTSTFGIKQLKVTQKEDRPIEVQISVQDSDPERVIHAVEEQCRKLFGETPLNVIPLERILIPAGKYRIIESRATASSFTPSSNLVVA
jgi:phenylacetate-CoA ligase